MSIGILVPVLIDGKNFINANVLILAIVKVLYAGNLDGCPFYFIHEKLLHNFSVRLLPYG